MEPSSRQAQPWTQHTQHHYQSVLFVNHIRTAAFTCQGLPLRLKHTQLDFLITEQIGLSRPCCCLASSSEISPMQLLFWSCCNFTTPAFSSPLPSWVDIPNTSAPQNPSVNTFHSPEFLLLQQTETWPGEEKASGSLTAAFQYIKGLSRKMEWDFLGEPIVTGQAKMVLN